MTFCQLQVNGWKQRTSPKLARFRKTNFAACFSHMWKIDPIQMQALSCMYEYIQNMFLKAGLLEKTKGGRKGK
jgi:hypothetical protein